MTELIPLDTGHAHVNYLKDLSNTYYKFRAHAELPNYYFPLFEGRLSSLKSIMQFRSTCPSPWNKNSLVSEGILTFDKSSGGMKMKTDFVVHFWDLSERVRYKIEDTFMRFLIDKSSFGDLKELAKKLGISYPYICQLRRGLYSTPSRLLVSIAQMA